MQMSKQYIEQVFTKQSCSHFSYFPPLFNTIHTMLRAERSAAKSFSAPVALGMPSLKQISAMPVPSNYDKPVPKDARFYAAHVTAIPYSRQVTSRPGVHIPTARTLSTNSPANHNHPAMTTKAL